MPLRRQGWQIDVVGWEELGPASGRAQANINPEVERCDVFLGILWNRWGTPTGDATSGFEEEWRLACRRHERTGRPDLWLYFKHLDGPYVDDEEDEQVRRVRQFRAERENDDVAFFKTFVDEGEFTALIRSRLLDEVLRRSGLTRTDIGGVAIDWSASYHDDPVALLSRGRDRKTLADELNASRPREAARLYRELADEIDAYGFQDQAEGLRLSACRALLNAGATDDGIGMLRRLLTRRVWWLDLDEVEHLSRQFGDELPPEFESERRAWHACSRAAEDPEHAASRLGDALTADHAFAVDEETAEHWRALRWRCLLHLGRLQEIVDDVVGLPEHPSTDVQLELALLYADALRGIHHPDANSAWAALRLDATNTATADPGRAAWIATRVAFDQFSQDALSEAEAAYADAASRWSATRGGQEYAAQAFFSAQASARLHDPWNLVGWGWRGLAAAQRSPTMTFARRADELETSAMHHRLEGAHARAVPPLVAALWCHERAGLAHGVLKDRSLLADAHAALGDPVCAVALHCRSANRKDAEHATYRATPAQRRTIMAAIVDGDWPSWAFEARCAALAAGGRCASSEVANRIVPEVIAGLEVSGRRFDNRPRTAADALADLVLAVDDQSVQATAIATLADLATHDDYNPARAGRLGLRMLSDVGETRHDDLLIQAFVMRDGVDEPDAAWVAERLTTPERIGRVSEAACRGRIRALLALIEADCLQRDPRLIELCRQHARGTLAADLGYTPDRTGIHGLMDLRATGMIAAASGDPSLIEGVAQRLVTYARETMWPMVNRINALAGVWAMRKSLLSVAWLTDDLRSLADPDVDLDDVPEHLFWSRDDAPAQLQAVALQVAAALTDDDTTPPWLAAAIAHAMVDDRFTLREAAWKIIGTRRDPFDETAALQAMRDPEASVRAAAISAWQRRATSPVPRRTLDRLATDLDNRVRFAVINLLAKESDTDAETRLCDDPDAYVRGVARSVLQAPSRR